MRHPLAAKYESGELHTVPVQNLPGYSAWFTDISGHLTPHLLEQQAVVAQDTRILLPEPFAFRGSHYFHCWVREFEGETFIVMTARVHGTCIEMVRPAGRMITSAQDGVIKRFVRNLQEQINKAKVTPMIHSFEIVVNEEITDEDADRLFEEGCDDCTPARSNGVNYVMFDREAPTREEAVTSAFEAIKRAGLTVKEVK